MIRTIRFEKFALRFFSLTTKVFLIFCTFPGEFSVSPDNFGVTSMPNPDYA
jgi:hypothetical protein